MGEGQGRITLWGAEVFLAVAEEGALSAAARRLGVSLSAVSQQLAGLETALGAGLVDRAARPPALTPAGQRFRLHAQAMIELAAQARAEIAQGAAATGSLRLGMIEDFEAGVTPRLLARLADRSPGGRLLLETGPSHRLVDLLEARALDLVVAADPGAEWEGAGMVLHPLLDDPFVVVAPPGTGGGAAALLALPAIRYSTRHLMGRQVAAHLARAGVRLAPRFELDSYAAILALVGQGQGWSVLTPLALAQARQGAAGVSVRALPWGAPARRIALIARAGALDDLAAAVADLLRPLLEEAVVAPALARHPWLAGRLAVCG